MRPGMIVESCAGRDSGRIFIVLSCEGEYAYIADGMLRKVDKPKRKKLKHLREIDVPDTAILNITNRQAERTVKEALRICRNCDGFELK